MDSGGYAQAAAQPAPSGRSRKLIRPFVSSTIPLEEADPPVRLEHHRAKRWNVAPDRDETGFPNSSATNWTTGNPCTVVLHCTTH
jgi:hypothetical protein